MSTLDSSASGGVTADFTSGVSVIGRWRSMLLSNHCVIQKIVGTANYHEASEFVSP